MATFLYSCEPCGIEFEAVQKHSDPNPPCTVCVGPTQRLIAGGTDFILRGTGWTGRHYLSPRIGTKPRRKPKSGT